MMLILNSAADCVISAEPLRWFVHLLACETVEVEYRHFVRLRLPYAHPNPNSVERSNHDLSQSCSTFSQVVEEVES
jgi:hypothetical protein